MKTIKIRLVIIIIICSMLSLISVGILSINSSNSIVDKNSAEQLNLLSNVKKLEIDSVINSITQSVNVLKEYSFEALNNPYTFRQNTPYVNQYTSELKHAFFTMAENTHGCLAVYIRYNPEFTKTTTGLFIVKDDSDGLFYNFQPTDLDLYDQGDIEHVGWYYLPANSGRSLWMEPYHNKNIDKYMISYVSPIIIDDICYGVVGMDIDFSYITSIVNNISIYESGYAFVINSQEEIIIHPDFEVYTPLSDFADGAILNFIREDNFENKNFTYNIDGKSHDITFSKLNNGMILCLSAPTEEIFIDSRNLTWKIAIITLICLACISLISILIISKVLKPVNIDPLTGVLNRTAFLNKTKSRLSAGRGDNYAFVMLDIDHFKNINDTQGHAAGDEAIKQIAVHLTRVLLAEDIVGRFGGDEFLIFMQCKERKIAKKRIEQVMELAKHGGTLNATGLSCSFGVVFSDDYNLSTETLLEQADKALYHAKNTGRNKYVFFDDIN